MKLVAAAMLVFLAASLVPIGYAPVERPSPGGKAFLLTLDVCNHGKGGLASQSMPFIPVFAAKVYHMVFAHSLEIREQDFKPLLLSVSKERPPKPNP
ncbi:MAG: hypothetical protein M0033_01730, partial [Nitrospiraceae bacterium]|nr:hypothetical protein [Nitrospiraceae bacterium]